MTQVASRQPSEVDDFRTANAGCRLDGTLHLRLVGPDKVALAVTATVCRKPSIITQPRVVAAVANGMN